MKSSFISSSAIQNAMRLTIRQAQNQMTKATMEATTGVYADIGVSLGGNAARSVDFSREVDRIASIKSSNSLVNARMESSQLGLSKMKDVGDGLVSKLTALQGSHDPGSITVAIQSATSALSTMMDTANTMVNGEYLFSGINTDVQPLTDKTTATSAAIVTQLNTYATGLGKAVSDLTGAEMSTFITTTVEPMFSETAWTDPTTGWSQASSQNMTSRISNSEVIESSTNANSEGMRYFALASVMTSALLGQNLSSDAMSTVSKQAISYTTKATSGLVTQASQLGLSQERVKKSNDALDAQSNIIKNKLVDLQGVDPYEASTLVKTLETQLETAYTIVSKIQQLSLVNYL
ncbi:flagellar hook-associated family protein [Rhizobium leguminosarum]|jgi:flagellar hook-associated protein 3 FlgL|uniref:Flagellin n=4 Tax=Rhizobium leguminosarum TaxID=384 RepID=A0A1B8RD86_RHILT|nr:flagellar hook-associated family protein [Rhizobium leguminosarum]AOO90376.1 flagellar hook-associated protein FlgL [Rhizobium leguminosarum bv. trifolii]ASS54413.1 flagellar biosynthesis protein FlgL [Rhizobium leguminosarum bv. viciae]AVC48292.1 bacterial flagellin C-terminal helical region family protein [Rhizobium leguminosarum bv. viciae]MBA8835949.1 flagellar hook-associated protein 3 FlgL [Rhizobium leguminosarum]MBA9031356.1 flagellar hook-associated protein 3 FlgL [Rhizobium legumi